MVDRVVQHSIETVEVVKPTVVHKVVIREGHQGNVCAVVSFLVCACFSFKMKTDDVNG